MGLRADSKDRTNPPKISQGAAPVYLVEGWFRACIGKPDSVRVLFPRSVRQERRHRMGCFETRDTGLPRAAYVSGCARWSLRAGGSARGSEYCLLFGGLGGVCFSVRTAYCLE